VEWDTLEHPSAGSIPRAASELTFTVFADRYGPAVELPGLRQSFTATSVSHAISVDHRHGIVTIAPGGATLRVGSDEDEYERVRVVERSMGLVGVMRCSPDGMVSWRAADDPSTPARSAGEWPAGSAESGRSLPAR
jgi:hypothetical protein